MINKVTLLGHVGQEPTIRQSNDGREIANFSLATTESWKDKNTREKKSKTEWHNIVAFGNVVQVIKNYVKKGSKLYLEGKLQTTKYTDKQGVTKYITEVIIGGFEGVLKMLDTKPQAKNDDANYNVEF